MFLNDGFNIKIPRGDSARVKFTLTEAETELPYIMPSGQSAELNVFTVGSTEPVISKSADSAQQESDGSVTFAFTPDETDIPRNVYNYTLKLVNVGGTERDTWLGFPESACFAVGMECPGSTGSLPDGGIRVEVTPGTGMLPSYEGAYTVTPSLTGNVVLDTAERSMAENVTVNRIPVSETINSAGGITLAIGG